MPDVIMKISKIDTTLSKINLGFKRFFPSYMEKLFSAYNYTIKYSDLCKSAKSALRANLLFVQNINGKDLLLYAYSNASVRMKNTSSIQLNVYSREFNLSYICELVGGGQFLIYPKASEYTSFVEINCNVENCILLNSYILRNPENHALASKISDSILASTVVVGANISGYYISPLKVDGKEKNVPLSDFVKIGSLGANAGF
ncbi:MAG: hypothetical protein WC492_02700 [Candidatus Micrarchaeia archaeon]